MNPASTVGQVASAHEPRTPVFDAELWRRLLEFRVDAPGAALPFLVRLAREQHGWTLSDAQAAWFEYLRFLYLARRAGHAVTPSNEVDAVWHLHLVYTRSYWDDLCPNVLGAPLHHGPTLGGAAEDQRYREQYEATLASYSRIFGESPPKRFWPPAGIRFRQQFETHDRRRSVAVPRAALYAAAVAAALALAALAVSR
jgi:hypothetical protein